MPKTSFVNARIEPGLKEKAEIILDKLGLSKTEAINLFYRQICLNDGLPFPVKIPNKTTLKVFKDTDASKNLVYAKNKKEFFHKLNN